MASIGDPDLRVPFEADTSAPAHVRAMLDDWLDHDDPGSYDIALAASELVTNAIVHTADGGEFRLWIADDLVRVEVVDRDRRPPRVAEPRGPDGGFGLRIVAQTSNEWGWYATSDGKIVWAQFVLNRTPERQTGTARN